MKNTKVLILAAGQGTRMRSKEAKVLHRLCGKPILEYVIDNAKTAGAQAIAVIVGCQAERVQATLPEEIKTYRQEEQLGTAHAVMTALPFFEEFSGNLMVLVGDAPFTRSETLSGLADMHQEKGYAATVLTAEFADPYGYGRMIKNQEGELLSIVEEKDASDLQKQIREINSGMYCFDAQALTAALKEVKTNNAAGEYYLTDVIEIIRKNGRKAGTFKTEDPDDIAAINSKVQLAEAETLMRKRINTALMESGVIMIDPATSYIGPEVKIVADAVILPGTMLEGKTVIGEDSVIGPHSRLRDAVIGNRVTVEQSTVLESSIDDETKVGPFAYIRPGSAIGKGCKVGDFVEVKNSNMGDHSKASHLTYIGDGDVGEGVNLGCGTVFVNYDGKKKYRTVVEDQAFVGCNTNLIAPVTVKKGSYIAAGSTITDEVPEDSLAIARCRQVNKVGYLKKKK
ncbi:bifunctional UDP-N-acetylglucosamine diphosphorylase/glucosamine-1-phosphate N-acetyltransferase GlmU [Eubacteriaceae bacterium ES3]|nr:bifunctional UDP-N-acetylglucosamine diphosphorylase/glucosamine-1-phosphate N-acetyltransferase GlmU [Eubacteriaceae bacterium ES3]